MCSLCNVLIQPPTAGGTEVDRLERQLTLAGLGTTPAFEQAQVGATAAVAAPLQVSTVGASCQRLS